MHYWQLLLAPTPPTWGPPSPAPSPPGNCRGNGNPSAGPPRRARGPRLASSVPGSVGSARTRWCPEGRRAPPRGFPCAPCRPRKHVVQWQRSLEASSSAVRKRVNDLLARRRQERERVSSLEDSEDAPEYPPQSSSRRGLPGGGVVPRARSADRSGKPDGNDRGDPVRTAQECRDTFVKTNLMPGKQMRPKVKAESAS